ncbi:protein nirf [Anaeramoeba ignava]|uniref:Protein nirf n=1 Tax=Anaeramoeba ignava TaxID=1746090 RepID=A0A9Q0LH73_ANAIG|nr:protein nirf [Anaeramoeba ignava]
MNIALLFFISITCFFFLVQSQVSISNSLNFPIGIDSSYASFLDEDEGFLYFLDQRSTDETYLWKYDMNTLDILNYTDIGISNGRYGAIDTVNKLLYVGSYPGAQFFKIDLNTMQVVDNITLSVSSYSNAIKVEIDTLNQKAYVGYQTPICIVKVDLASFTEESNLTLSNDFMTGSVIDVDNGILYAATDSNPVNDATIHKIDLSTFAQVDSLLVNLTGMARLNYGVIDNSTQMMYFGTYQNPINIVKINLADLTSVGSKTIYGQRYCYGAGIDETNGLAYFLSENGNINKLSLATFTITESKNFNTTSGDSMVLDSSAENAYITSDLAQVVHVNLPALTEANRSDSIVYTEARVISIDSTNKIAYIYFKNLGGIIAKIDLQSFSLIDYLIIGLYENIQFGELDLTNGFMYLFPQNDDITIIKIRLSNFSFEEFVTVVSDLYVRETSFDQQNQIIYILSQDFSNGDYYLHRISSPDLQIIDSLLLSDINVYGVYVDSPHGYLYLLIYDYAEVGSKYFIYKIELTNLSIIDEVNLTQYNIRAPVLDKTHQFIYFGDYNDYYLICRLNLANMQVMNDCWNTSFDNLYDSFMISNDAWVYFYFDYCNPSSGGYEIALLQIEASSNQLISSTVFNQDLFESYLYASDPSTNYGYLLDYYSTPVTLYQFSFTSPPSSSQQILFSFLIFGMMILILGLF